LTLLPELPKNILKYSSGNEPHSVKQMIDPIDIRILDVLQTDGKTPLAQVAEAVGLSVPAVHERIRKLEQAGVIRGYVARVDPEKVGAGVTAFVEVYVEHPSQEAPLIAAVTAVSEVQEMHHVTGESSLLLKVRTASIDTLRQLLLETINVLPGVRQTRTSIVLATAKEDTRVSLAALGATHPPENGHTTRRRGRKEETFA
jgi:Lrp/AsnC family leucine-responsive transcriptional regulator